MNPWFVAAATVFVTALSLTALYCVAGPLGAALGLSLAVLLNVYGSSPHDLLVAACAAAVRL